ncbi:hypothetical protein ACPPVO_41645 [Dactylosporangium sp. McL0621]|uniref:hypothetical protein n=1 Tax=Dactylosporangium sp. McL0621 TaxID=3415678 RepID=UPI003CF27B28
MLTLLAGCGGSDQGPVTAAGWTSDGDVVLVRDAYDEPAVLWTGHRGGRLHGASLSGVCYGATVRSIFTLTAPKIGLAVSCGGNDPRLAFVSFDPATGQAQPLAAVSNVNLPLQSDYGGGTWSEPDGSAFVGYTTLGCAGVGTLTGAAVHPLDIGIALPGGPIQLADALPEAGGAGCTAHALAQAPSLSPHGRYRAFFMHVCATPCNGPMPDARPGPAAIDGIWPVVVQDRVNGTVTVSDAQLPRTAARPRLRPDCTGYPTERAAALTAMCSIMLRVRRSFPGEAGDEGPKPGLPERGSAADSSGDSMSAGPAATVCDKCRRLGESVPGLLVPIGPWSLGRPAVRP